MSEASIRRRIGDLMQKIGEPIPAGLEAKNAGLEELHAFTVKHLGTGRAAWLSRCASGRSTPADDLILQALPASALAAAQMTALQFVQLIDNILNEF